MSELGLVLHMLRRRKGWTQGQVAKKANTTPEYVSQLESGKRLKPSAELLTRLAVALETTPDYILTEAGILPRTESPALPPEVLELAEVVDAYPNGAEKEQAKRIIIDLAHMLRSLRGATNDDTVSTGGADLRPGAAGDR